MLVSRWLQVDIVSTRLVHVLSALGVDIYIYIYISHHDLHVVRWHHHAYMYISIYIYLAISACENKGQESDGIESASEQVESTADGFEPAVQIGDGSIADGSRPAVRKNKNRNKNKSVRRADQRAKRRLNLATLRLEQSLDWQRKPTEEEVQAELVLLLQELEHSEVPEPNFYNRHADAGLTR